MTLLKVEPSSDSGIGLSYRTLADALAIQGHAVHIVHPTNRPAEVLAALRDLEPRWTYDVVPALAPRPLRFLARGGPWQRRALVERFWTGRCANGPLARACATRNLEVIETHAFAAPALFFLRRRRRPPVVSRISTTTAQMMLSSGETSRALRWLARAEMAAANGSDALLTHTAAHREEICRVEGYDSARISLIPHGLPDPGLAPAEGEKADSPEFLFVGRFEPRKGIDVLLAAIPRVAAACPRATFVLAGDTGSGDAWRIFSDDHPDLVPSRVTAPGRVSEAELDRLYRRCSVLVAPSRYESFGLIYIEAMGRGKPVIGCSAGGIPEVVAQGRNGLLAEPGDPSTLAECMIRLAADPRLRSEYGAAGRKEFVARFSADEFARRSAEFYATVRRRP